MISLLRAVVEVGKKILELLTERVFEEKPLSGAERRRIEKKKALLECKMLLAY